LTEVVSYVDDISSCEFFHRVSIQDEIIRRMYQQFKSRECIQTAIYPINQKLKSDAQHIKDKHQGSI